MELKLTILNYLNENVTIQVKYILRELSSKVSSDNFELTVLPLNDISAKVFTEFKFKNCILEI